MGAPAKTMTDRSALPLALVETAYVVGYRRPLSDLSQEKQKQIRDAYADTEWATDYSIELAGIYTSHALAKKAASKPGHFLMSLPVNSSRPEANGRYGLQQHPASDAAKWYEKTSPEMVGVDHIERRELERVIRRCNDNREALQTLVDL